MRLLAIAPALLLAGCIIEDFDRRPPRPSATRVIPRDYTSHGPNCPDIIAAATGNSDDRKIGPLKILAARMGLSIHEQIHIVDIVMDQFSYDDKRAAVLEVLAENGDLTPEARMHLARRIREMSSQGERITAALLRNPPKSAPPPPPPPPPDPQEVADDGSCALLGVSVTTTGRVVVVSVVEKGVADQAGLKVGDFILAINDWEVSDFKSWRNGIRSEIAVKKAGEAWIKAERSGTRIAVNVVVTR